MPEFEPGGLPPGYKPVNPENADRSELVYLLQKGVFLRLPEAVAAHDLSVTDFLLHVLNLDDESFRDEIRTMMRNNMVVDDPDHTYLNPDDVLVVSGAMPGLVGAMLRSDSPIKILRSTISANTEREVSGEKKDSKRSSAFIMVKLFNTVLRDHLDDVLKYGIYKQENDS
jgi:hypothetical protein